MSLKEVLLYWAYISIGMVFLLFLALQFFEVPYLNLFSWAFLFFSAILSPSLFFILRLIKTKNKNISTTGLVFFLTNLRLLFSAVFLLSFIFGLGLKQVIFVVPFLFIYVVYKVLEVYCFIKYSNHIDKRIKQNII